MQELSVGRGIPSFDAPDRRTLWVLVVSIPGVRPRRGRCLPLVRGNSVVLLCRLDARDGTDRRACRARPRIKECTSTPLGILPGREITAPARGVADVQWQSFRRSWRVRRHIGAAGGRQQPHITHTIYTRLAAAPQTSHESDGLVIQCDFISTNGLASSLQTDTGLRTNPELGCRFKRPIAQRASLVPRLKAGFHTSVVRGNSMDCGESRSFLTSPLVKYALKGLQRCWLPEHGRWSHVYHLDGRDQPNEFSAAERRVLHPQCATRPLTTESGS